MPVRNTKSMAVADFVLLMMADISWWSNDIFRMLCCIENNKDACPSIALHLVWSWGSLKYPGSHSHLYVPFSLIHIWEQLPSISHSFTSVKQQQKKKMNIFTRRVWICVDLLYYTYILTYIMCYLNLILYYMYKNQCNIGHIIKTIVIGS